MNHARMASLLSRAQRNLLIKHIDGSFDVPVMVQATTKSVERDRLVRKGLIRPNRSTRPTKTLITEDGRRVLATLLAEYAEALVRAGYGGVSSPISERPRPMAPAVDPVELAPAFVS